MSFADEAIGVCGGVAEEAYGRDEETAFMLEIGRRPDFYIEGPYRTNENFNRWATDFYFQLNPAIPWLPEQVFDEFLARFRAARPEFQAARVTVTMRALDVSGPNQAAFPTPRTERWTPALQRAYEFARVGGTYLATATVDPDNADFAAFIDKLNRADRYDADDGAVGVFGNRVSRVVFTVVENRVPPAGNGDGDGLPFGCKHKTLVDLRTPTHCGQACLAYAMITPESIGGDAQTAEKRAYNRRVNWRKRPATALKAAKALAAELGIESEMGLDQMQAFVDYYAVHPDEAKRASYRVMVRRERFAPMFITDTRGRLDYTDIHLLLHRGHYYFIASVDGFVKPTADTRVTCCRGCGERRYDRHDCTAGCPGCKHVFATEAERKTHCAEAGKHLCASCNFVFPFPKCVEFHACRFWRCPDCFKATRPVADRHLHVCGEALCRNCYEICPPGHRCFILPIKAGCKLGDEARIYAYDIESMLDVAPDGRIKHNIGVIVVTRLYTRESVTFRGVNAGVVFRAWCGAQKKKTVLVAHNAAAYDTCLLFEAFTKIDDEYYGKDYPTELIKAGAKIVQMKVGKVIFRDSMKHVPGSLESLARAFGLPAELQSKGFFPYRFYTTANRDYIGPIPSDEWFDVPAAKMDAYREWRAGIEADLEATRSRYVLEEECVKYCRQDVEMLAAAMERYRDAAISIDGIDPLSRATIASHVLASYRKNDMPVDSIALLSRTEYDFARRGFHGGRTEVRQLYRKWSPEDVAAGRHGKYVDVVSLYPTVMRYDPLPSGVPEMVCVGEPAETWISRLHADGKLALVECSYVPPRDKYHPVLVRNARDRLLADLEPVDDAVVTCREIALALRHGYTFELRRAMVFTARSDMFASYIDRGMKLKHAAKRDGNAALYTLAKLKLNSLWGKFGQKDQDGKVVVYSSPVEWFKDVHREHRGTLTLDVAMETEEYIVANRALVDREDLHLKTTNVALAAFVTANARLRLYAGMDTVGESLLAMDTDSVIYAAGPGVPDIPVGEALGEWSDETLLNGEADPIVEYCGLGPKTYAYRTLSGAEVVKSKGFPTCFTLADYKRLLDAYYAGTPTKLETPELLHFARGDGIWTIPNFRKYLQFDLQKVHVVDYQRTLPWGHSEITA